MSERWKWSPGAVGERLRHEGGDHALLRGHGREEVAESDDPVRGGERVGVLEVLLELSVAVLVVVGVVAPAQLVHGSGHRGEVFVHPGEATDVVAGLVGVVCGIGGDERTVVGTLEQEVLDLGPHPGLEASVGGLCDEGLEDVARGERPRLALDVRIALDDGEAFLDERDREEGADVGDRDEVGVLWLLADGTDRVAGETYSLRGEFVDRLDRNQLGARLSAKVDEHGEDELGVGRRTQLGEGTGVGGCVGGGHDALRGRL